MVAPRFTKIFSITLIVALLASSVQSAECPPESKSQVYAKEEKDTYIVVFKKGSEVSGKTDGSIAEKHFEYMKDCLNKKVQHISEKGVSTKSSDDDVLRDFSVEGLQGYTGKFGVKFVEEQLKKMDGVAIVEKDQEYKINLAIPRKRTVAKDPPASIDRIDQAKFPLDGKYEFPDTAGKGVNIFVIDTGIQTEHEEFENRAKFGGSFCEGCNDQDENGHGTHVASIAAGKTLGVARKANVIAVRVLDANGSGSNAVVIEGMTFVLDQHNKGKNKNSVVNMSLGGGFSEAVNTAVQSLTDAGVHVVVAAGNEASDSCTKSPASAPTAITVGATEEKDDTIANFSNFGKCNDIFAPGVNIRGADFSNVKGEKIFSGTSQATPHVAGTVALIIAKDGNKSPAAMAKELDQLATKNVVKGINGKQKSKNSFLRVPAP